MTGKDIMDRSLRFLEILISWPVLLLIVVFVVRRQLPVLVSKLADRITKAPGGFEFAPPAVSALQDTIEAGAEQYKDQPEQLVQFVREQVKKLPELRGATPATDRPALAGRSILWVDNQPMNNTYEANVLKRLGASILFARSNDEAEAHLKQDRFDLVISDIGRGLQRDAGYNLLEHIRSSHRRLPVIFYTGNAANADSARVREAYGVTNTPGDLINLVVRALEGS
jgi:CheY-like chemotaxis protein